MPKAESVSQRTIDHLLQSYISERNASARYVAFAVQADKEKFFGVASLFRAVANSEQVHATNHARVLLNHGAELGLTAQPLEVRSTIENLRASFANELEERDETYPSFARDAEDDTCVEARESFRLAGQGEAEHAMLFATALENIEEYRRRSPYMICMRCGWVSSSPELKHCLLCNSGWDRFERID